MHLRSYGLNIVQVPIQDCTVQYLLHVYSPKLALIQDNKIPARKDKRYNVSVIIIQIKLVSIVFITTFSNNIVIKYNHRFGKYYLPITEKLFI